jgi:acetyltransferase-like isoleucine patch superfamily enzyme
MIINRLRSYIWRKKNISRAVVGRNSEITGVIDKRHPDSKITIGNDCLVEGIIVGETNLSNVVIGDNVYIGGGTIIDCVNSIVIDNDVLVAYECVISDSNNHSIRYSIRRNDLAQWKKGRQHDWGTTPSRPVKICKGAWIGLKSIILQGVTIGEGAIVGAGSVVTRSVPPYTIVAGNPARVIREIPEDER